MNWKKEIEQIVAAGLAETAPAKVIKPLLEKEGWSSPPGENTTAQLCLDGYNPNIVVSATGLEDGDLAIRVLPGDEQFLLQSAQEVLEFVEELEKAFTAAGM